MYCLIDCNNFFVSCEKVFNPKLKNKPCVVLSNNDGCVIARSNEAKALRINMGDPIFLHKKLINDNQLEAFSSNFVLYGDMSNRVMEVIKSFNFDMEVYSIDEAFLKLDVQADQLYFYAKEIKEKILSWTGIPVSIGIAPTKTLCKIAGNIAKKDKGIQIFDNEEIIDRSLEKTKVEDIWSIGKSSSATLRRLNIINARQFKYADEKIIKKHLKICGVRTQMELMSICAHPLQTGPHSQKTLLCSRSFPKETDSFDLLKKAIAFFAGTAAEKLRKQQCAASFLTLFISTSRFKQEKYYSNSATIGFTVATNYTPEIIKGAEEALKQIFIEGLFYKKAGILLSALSEKKYVQQDIFFNSNSYNKKDRAMKALDQINSQFDKNSVFFASQGMEKCNFLYKQAKKSHRYTTCWDELLEV